MTYRIKVTFDVKDDELCNHCLNREFRKIEDYLEFIELEQVEKQ